MLTTSGSASTWMPRAVRSVVISTCHWLLRNSCSTCWRAPWLSFAMEGRGVDAPVVQFVGHVLCAVAAGHEHQHALALVLLDQIAQHRRALGGIHVQRALLNGGVFRMVDAISTRAWPSRSITRACTANVADSSKV